jgi:hypothetical protein
MLKENDRASRKFSPAAALRSTGLTDVFASDQIIADCRPLFGGFAGGLAKRDAGESIGCP